MYVAVPNTGWALGVWSNAFDLFRFNGIKFLLVIFHWKIGVGDCGVQEQIAMMWFWSLLFYLQVLTEKAAPNHAFCCVHIH